MVLNQEYVVYIMASSTGPVYIGMTGFFFTRVGQHKAEEIKGLSRLPVRAAGLFRKLRQREPSHKPREAAQALDPRGKNRFDREQESAVEGSG